MEEDTTTRQFEGTSNRGDIYEALDNAVEAAKQGLRTDMVEWTLSKTSGVYGGFVLATDLTITIEARVFQSAGDDAQPATTQDKTMQSEGGGQIQVPVFLSGLVSKITGVDFCMDGATHRLETLIGMARLKADNDEVQKFFGEVAGSRVAIAGYPVWGPECVYIRVYYAAPVEELFKRFGTKS